MKNHIFSRIASLRGTHPLAVPFVLSRVVRSVRHALHPKSAVFMRTLNLKCCTASLRTPRNDAIYPEF